MRTWNCYKSYVTFAAAPLLRSRKGAGKKTFMWKIKTNNSTFKTKMAGLPQAAETFSHWQWQRITGLLLLLVIVNFLLFFLVSKLSFVYTTMINHVEPKQVWDLHYSNVLAPLGERQNAGCFWYFFILYCAADNFVSGNTFLDSFFLGSLYEGAKGLFLILLSTSFVFVLLLHLIKGLENVIIDYVHNNRVVLLFSLFLRCIFVLTLKYLFIFFFLCF